MSRIYATEENGARHLVRLECDEPGCAASIRPHPEIAQSGWTKRGVIDVFGQPKVNPQWDYCSEHS